MFPCQAIAPAAAMAIWSSIGSMCCIDWLRGLLLSTLLRWLFRRLMALEWRQFLSQNGHYAEELRKEAENIWIRRLGCSVVRQRRGVSLWRGRVLGLKERSRLTVGSLN